MMKALKYHPLVKFLVLALFVLALEGTVLFLWESVVSLSGSYYESLTVQLFHFRLYFPVLLAWTIVLAVVTVLLLAFLCSVAGCSDKDGAVRVTTFHKIPLDLLLLAVFLAGVGLFGFTMDVVMDEFEFFSDIIAYYAIFFLPTCAVLLALLLMSLTVRFRTGTWWRNNVITYAIRLMWRIVVCGWKLTVRICRVLWRGISRGGRAIWRFVSEIPTVPLALLFIASIFVFGLFGLFAESVFLIFLTGLYAVFGILLGAIFSRRLEKGAQKLAEGDLESRVDSSNMFGAYRKHAEHLNHIREGMSEAVEAQLRSERMKTELITNVSHDIKTPLTSIINYVDLMKKEPIESDTVKEYLEIMDRQSTRLKKLIEDLIEVSKTSTGNIKPEMVVTDFGVLLEQVLGEYRERLTEKDLTLCVNHTAGGAQILMDGKLFWRVFDNLFGNICKYSMPGTRVYLNTEVKEGILQISLRNISLYSLNITSEELMERFVRGDRSRHTDGSGLGLSIAKNLVELQKGKLELVIDGDLFKAILSFPVV